MTQPIEHRHSTVRGREAGLPTRDDVFPRWFTLLVVTAWMAVMAWAITYSSITLT